MGRGPLDSSRRAKRPLYDLADPINLVLAELRIQRQRQTAPGDVLGDRQRVAQRLLRVGRKTVHWLKVQPVLDPGIGQVPTQRVAKRWVALALADVDAGQLQ